LRLVLAILIAAQALPLRAPDPVTAQFNFAPRTAIESRLRDSSSSNTEREGILKQMFEASGCKPPALTEQRVDRETLPNVICTLAGTGPAVIIVGAHFDHVRAGQGIVDNWSGASLLPALYGGLHNAPRKHGFVFIGFTDEERGLVGSRYYAAHLTAQQRARIRAMVNLDSLGLGPTKVFLSHSDRTLFEKFDLVARGMKLPAEVLNVRGADEDSESFRKLGIPTLMLHSVTPPLWRVLHSPRDTLAAIDMASYYESYRLLGAYLAYLDDNLQ
jgi:Iap family predicted aminopeptidase